MVLVLINFICIVIKLVIDFSFKKFETNLSSLNQSLSDNIQHFYSVRFVVEILEHTLQHINSIFHILFLIEIILKIIYMPNSIFKDIFEMFDVFAILLSLIVNVLLFILNKYFYTVGGLLTVLRLLRIKKMIKIPSY